jgi:hypothetical protein
MRANWTVRNVVQSLCDPVPTYPKRSWFEPHFVGEYMISSGYSHTGRKSRHLQASFVRGIGRRKLEQ